MAIRWTARVQIAAPRDRVYAALTDLDSPREWLPSLVKLEQLTAGGFGAGTRWREHRKFKSHTAHEVFEVVAADAPNGFEVYVDGKLGTTGSGYYRYVYALETTPAGTAVTLDGVAGGGGWLAALLATVLAPLLRRMMARLFSRDLEALKAHLEKRTGAWGRA